MRSHNRLPVIALLASLAIAPCAHAADPAPAAAQSAPAISPAMGKGGTRQQILSQLPADKSKMYQDAIADVRAKNRPVYEQIDKLHQDIASIMTAEKFDKAAYLAKNAEIDKSYAQMRTNTAEAIAGVAEKFTPAERKILEELHQSMIKRAESFRSRSRK